MRIPRFTTMNLLILTTAAALLLSQYPFTRRAIYVPRVSLAAGALLLVATVWLAVRHRERDDFEADDHEKRLQN